MLHRLLLAASACALIVAALPAAAQNYNNPQQSNPQSNYPIGRAANDAGPNYSGTQNTQNTQNPPEQRNSYYNYAPGFAGGAPDNSATAWCQARFRSFDPATGTFMGFDGVRHPCP
jgi:opacity protein-like surface antigen